MSNLVTRVRTTEPTARPSLNHWFLYISGRDLDLSDVKYNSQLGRLVLSQYEEKPHEVVKLLKELYSEDPHLVANVIGERNVKKIVGK